MRPTCSTSHDANTNPELYSDTEGNYALCIGLSRSRRDEERIEVGVGGGRKYLPHSLVPMEK
jgi:hypothetical protein